MGSAASGTGAPRGVFKVDQDAVLAELELAWAVGGYHGFTADGGTWCTITSAGQALTGGTPDELNQAIRTHWQALQ